MTNIGISSGRKVECGPGPRLPFYFAHSTRTMFSAGGPEADDHSAPERRRTSPGGSEWSGSREQRSHVAVSAHALPSVATQGHGLDHESENRSTPVALLGRERTSGRVRSGCGRGAGPVGGGVEDTECSGWSGSATAPSSGKWIQRDTGAAPHATDYDDKQHRKQPRQSTRPRKRASGATGHAVSDQLLSCALMSGTSESGSHSPPWPAVRAHWTISTSST